MALADATPPKPPPIVRVFVAGPPEAVAGARDAVQQICAPLNVAVVVHDAAGAEAELLAATRPPGLAQAYVDLRSGTPARIVVVDSQTGEDLVRRTLPASASLEMSVETAAHVVCAAVESSLSAADGQAARRRQEARDTDRAPPPTRSSRAGDRGGGVESRVGVFGALSNFGFGFHGGVGALFEARAGRSDLRLGGILSLVGYVPGHIDRDGGEASFALIGARLLPVLDWQASHAVSLFAGAGIGGDWVRVAASRPPAGTIARDAGASVEAIASAMCGGTLELAGSVGVLGALGIDADLSRHRYVTEAPEETQSFYQPPRLRPVALVGLSVTFGGARAGDGTSGGEVRH
jgi:hypothetical protein